jgi:hypothetical protein
MSRRALMLTAVVIAGAAGWYAFRPERLFIDKTVNETLPAATVDAQSMAAESVNEPVALLAGRFHTNAHETKGVATIYSLPGGQRVLRLTGFETSNGPDVQVYLVAAADVNDNETVKAAGFVNVGALKGNIGDQNYDIPADLDLAKYRAVTIWCRRFGVNFGTAPLAAGSATMGANTPVKTEFTVTVENISTGMTLKLSNGQTAPAPTAPVLYLVHTAPDPLFTGNARDRGLGLETLAEQGNPSDLVKSLTGKPGIVSIAADNMPVGAGTAGPLTPGHSYRFSFTAAPGQRLSLAMMFAQSNDLFFGTDGAGIALFNEAGKPLDGDITTQLTLWDAGTEVNQEPGLGADQAPRQATPTSGTVENGVVRLVHDQFRYPSTAQVLRVTISSNANGMSAGM